MYLLKFNIFHNFSLTLRKYVLFLGLLLIIKKLIKNFLYATILPHDYHHTQKNQ